MRFPRQTFAQLRDLLRPLQPDPAQELFRLKAVERDVILPIKGLYLAILTYYFVFSAICISVRIAVNGSADQAEKKK